MSPTTTTVESLLGGESWRILRQLGSLWRILEAVRIRVSKTETGRTEGKWDGGKFLEDQSKAAIRWCIHWRERVASGGQERGK